MDKESVRPGEEITYSCAEYYSFENITVLPYLTMNYTGTPSQCDEEEYTINPLGEYSKLRQVIFFFLLQLPIGKWKLSPG